MAQTTPQVALWSDMYYEGDSVQVPTDNDYHALSEFQPDLWQCLGIIDDADTKKIGSPGMSSLYNIDFNDKLVNIACLTPAQNSY
ncbi:hypothetical protein BO79DRAFT_254023 [Aspergillus costaricaensis CBS 115574]|uniref:Uncharacterized protein n=1 Tax=Aspergillus costaricaensis CBS 115574 TaxID=1448317 RepID=A0ACD1IJK5_9EURO|nr:hypothetical protein BO79DRAFT_254023 [Aspergillus costaricaensis CBS 115574]RAK89930.1 hypothetical protein BO79DRAFT_254023 [Aspergillus costaricaensis CBS 115574]